MKDREKYVPGKSIKVIFHQSVLVLNTKHSQIGGNKMD